MSGHEILLSDIFKNHNKIKNISAYDLLTKYIDESLTDKQTFLNFLQHLYAYAPWAIKALIMGAPNSVYALKELFRDEISLLLPEPKYKYGSQSLYHLLNEIEKNYINQSILNETYRKRVLFKAAEVLNNDDYKVFLLIINNEFNPKIYQHIEELYNDNNLPENIYKYFLFSLIPKEFSSIPDNLFNNNTNSANMFFPKGDIHYYLVFNNVCIKLDNKFTAFKKDANEQDTLYNMLIKRSSSNNGSPVIFIADDEDIIGIITHNGVYIYKQTTTVTEHVFSIKICQGLKNAFIIEKNTSSRGLPKIIGLISYDNGTIEKCTKQVSSFTINVLPYFGYTASLITCQEKDTNNSFFVFALSERANKLGKNLKSFKLASLIGRYFYVG